VRGHMTREELFDRTIPEPNSGCWFWDGKCDRAGYGVVATRPRHLSAHRLAYQLFCGEIPEGGCILHSCDQPSCINPDHLRVGSHGDNSNDRVARGRAAGPKGERHAAALLSASDVLAIRADTRRHRLIAADYGISARHVSSLKAGLYWKHIA